MSQFASSGPDASPGSATAATRCLEKFSHRPHHLPLNNGEIFMTHRLRPLLYPQSVAFVGGSNLAPTLRFHRELSFGGETWIVSPKYDHLEGYPCYDHVRDLPAAPDLAFVAIPREAAIEAIAALRDIGCRGVICNGAGFAESGPNGGDLQARLVDAAGDMPMLGPNTVGLANFVVPMGAMMDNLGAVTVEAGVAIVSQGGGLLEDALNCDRGLHVSHVVGGGNQAVTGVEEFVECLVEDPRVTAVGLSFEALRDVSVLRRAAWRAVQLGKPIVALKFGLTPVGAHAAMSHTASMAGDGAMWAALLDRLGIILTRSTSEFFETLKLMDAGQLPRGHRVLVTAGSGLQSVLAADHLSGAGFELPQPTGEHFAKLRELLPEMATPCNPQDITSGVWWNPERSSEVYSALLDQGYDAVVMVQNHPRTASEHTDEYSAQVAALGDACRGRDIASIQVAPMIDCFPSAAREHSRSVGLTPMQGLEEFTKALGHAVWWRQRRDQLVAAGTPVEVPPPRLRPFPGEPHDEASAKRLLAAAGVSVPRMQVASPEAATSAANELGYPVVVKALDARLLHKTEVGAVRLGLESSEAVHAAVEGIRANMRVLVPDIPLTSVLVETMVRDVVVELMASVTYDPAVGMVMMVASGGVEAELWNDKALIASPFSRVEIERGLNQLKAVARLDGWRGRPGGDRAALLNMLEAIGEFAMSSGVEEIEINPILVGRHGAVAADAFLRIASPSPSSSSPAGNGQAQQPRDPATVSQM